MQEETIARVWDSFAARIIPPDASPGQREDMQTSFYAGALAVLSLVESLGNAPNQFVAIILLNELHAELHAFADARAAGINANGATRNDQE